MCGICGEFSLQGGTANEAGVRSMADAISYRGPDDRGFHVSGPIGLGHLRLSIIDTSSRGHQPMWTRDRTMAVTYNGEIYNFAEIMRELEALGYQFESNCDTEVVVNAVHAWGAEAAVGRFIGMFAFAIWDSRKSELTLVRDRAGIKPLFYYKDENVLLFGSEVRAILAHPAFRKEIDPRGIGQFFVTGYTLGETSAFRNVSRVLPGHVLRIRSDGSVTDTEYWSLSNYHRGAGPADFTSAAEELESLLESAIGYRLVADVPVANFLSGGTDSSLVASILKRNLGKDVLNITIGFEEKDFDEAPKAKLVAEALGLNHLVHYISVKDIEGSLALFPEIFDEPFGDTSGIPTYILSRVAREHVKVALSADGGDEQFCGYDSYLRYSGAWNMINKVPAPLRQAAAFLARSVPRGLTSAVANAAGATRGRRPQALARLDKGIAIARVETIGDLIRTMFEKAWTWDNASEVAGSGRQPLFDRTVLADPEIAATDCELIDTMMRADYRAFLRDDILTKTDRASMHVSLEARDPLLDHRIAEFAFGLPLEVLFGNGEQKRLLKHLLRKSIPENVVASPKRGFSIPLYAWTRGVWRAPIMEALSPEAVRKVGILSPRVVAREVEAFYKYPGGSAERIWMLMNFQLWAQRWL